MVIALHEKIAAQTASLGAKQVELDARWQGAHHLRTWIEKLKREIARRMAGPGLLADVAVSKFADLLPLYRQSQIYVREGVELERSTLADLLGGTARLVRSLLDALSRYVLSARRLQTLGSVSKKSDLAVAIRYAMTCWPAMTRYCDDGAIEIDNNAAERALRTVAFGRRNWLLAGSDNGGTRAAVFCSLVRTAMLNGMDPEAYLRYVLERIADQAVNRIDELLPWSMAGHLASPQRLAA